jgi:hypothetical protein
VWILRRPPPIARRQIPLKDPREIAAASFRKAVGAFSERRIRKALFLRANGALPSNDESVHPKMNETILNPPHLQYKRSLGAVIFYT